MATRLAALIVCTCLSVGSAHGQTAPNLTRQQRDLLHAVVTAVDAARAKRVDRVEAGISFNRVSFSYPGATARASAR